VLGDRPAAAVVPAPPEHPVQFIDARDLALFLLDMAEQRADGGWGQRESMACDAYATGQSLYALQAAGIKPSNPAYQKGVKFLLATQKDDGSWFVASRSAKFQPYFESSFPHGHDQWISSAATSWAAAALAHALDSKPAVRAAAE
jgi:hypothetical protein